MSVGVNMEKHYWEEKRVGFRQVLSAWALAAVLIALSIAVTSLAGRESCSERAECGGGGQPLSFVADGRSR